jgi:hypothetical protein
VRLEQEAEMKAPLFLTLPLLLLTGGVAFGQGVADRISTQSDISRAQTEGRFNKLGSETRTETIVREKVIDVPVRTTRKARGAELLGGNEPSPVRTKRVVVRRTETVTKPAPLRINPY